MCFSLFLIIRETLCQLITHILYQKAVPLTILPHYLTLGIDLNGVHVSRTAHPLARVGDAERGEQRIELVFFYCVFFQNKQKNK